MINKKCPQSSKRLSGSSCQQRALHCLLFALKKTGTGSTICSEAVIRLYFELRDEGQAEANIAAAVARGVVVAISRPAVPRVAVPVATTNDMVRTHD